MQGLPVKNKKKHAKFLEVKEDVMFFFLWSTPEIKPQIFHQTLPVVIAFKVTKTCTI